MGSNALAHSAEVFFTNSGCVGCHHQPMMARAYAAMEQAGLPADARLKKSLVDGMVTMRPFFAGLPTLNGPPGDTDTVSGTVSFLKYLGEGATPMTDESVHYMAARQEADGSWLNAGVSRRPLETSPIITTAAGIRLLRAYSWPARESEFQARIAKARDWMLAAKPIASYEHAERIMGLKEAGVSAVDLRKAGDALLREQKSDGGWSSNPHLDSDAYATGIALRALYEAEVLKPSDAAYQKGVAYLLKTQFPDGSWYVRSRAAKFQPYFDGGFPFAHDQWISVAGTAWAVAAIAPAAR
jgi:hypothetical protein